MSDDDPPTPHPPLNTGAWRRDKARRSGSKGWQVTKLDDEAAINDGREGRVAVVLLY